MIMNLLTAGEQYYCNKDGVRVSLTKDNAYLVDLQTSPLLWDVRNKGMVYASIKFKVPINDVIDRLKLDTQLELI